MQQLIQTQLPVLPSRHTLPVEENLQEQMSAVISLRLLNSSAENSDFTNIYHGYIHLTRVILLLLRAVKLVKHACNETQISL